jgi:hypothetical protein
MAGCGQSLFCTEEDCTRRSWSGGLCQRHYEAELKRRHAYQPPARSNGSGDYDVRFCSLFTNELELCGRPQYPEPHWFGALRRADAGFKDLGPPLSLKPQLYATETGWKIGVRERIPRPPVTLEMVNAACSRFLHERGLISRLY